MKPFTMIVLSALALTSLSPTAQADDWLSGGDYWRQLETSVDKVSWSGVPFRQAVMTLSRSQRICFWIDRRVDPGIDVQFACANESLDVLLRRMTLKLGGGVGYLESVVYLGPKPVAAKLATIAALRAEEVKELPASRRAVFEQRRAMRWPELTSPREILEELSREAGITMVEIERVPHDLWPANSLPPLPFVERLSLVLAGFELTFEFAADGTAVRLVDMPGSAVLKRSYSPRGDVARAVRELASIFPEVQAARRGSRLEVLGTYEDHVAVERWLRGERVRRAATGGETRYTLSIQNQPLGGVLKSLALSLGYQLNVDPQVVPKLHELVTFRVENATVEELLKAALRDSGIRHGLQGDVLSLTSDRE